MSLASNRPLKAAMASALLEYNDSFSLVLSVVFFFLDLRLEEEESSSNLTPPRFLLTPLLELTLSSSGGSSAGLVHVVVVPSE